YFGEGHDPDSLRLAHGEAAVAAALDGAADGVSSEIDRLLLPAAGREPLLEAKAAGQVAELLRPIPDPILRFSYGRIAAERLKIPVDMLVRRMGTERPGGKVTPAGPGPAVSPVAAGPRLVRSVEEQVLQSLVAAEGVPPVADLPPAEVFLDTECRNIYQAFCTLYAESGGKVPDARALAGMLSTMGQADRTVDRMASILVEGSFAPGKSGRLSESLEKLTRRWQQQRLRELASEIAEAQRKGDQVRLESLLKQKTSLSHRFHRGAQPMAGGESG
ncbi:MAG: hypothetical protein M3O15_05980, partial [Acidobacteriota bacterium]|nr:hypothetical protein [Acidobacteriota bacterium]